ncbi:capsid protein [Tuber aestivum virus 1]|uniref:Capsid protein n=1 Tax=Tuber aestivum virus 1 TaxID=927810 RepID=E5KIN6_9VIRU|nr:capsid protein [Tuber aestivum virus 1]ADQ54105.1 capsid protein [Tuber aestivum virus 1]
MYKTFNSLSENAPVSTFETIQSRGTTSLMTRLRLNLAYDNLDFNRVYSSKQDYTWLGKAAAFIVEAELSLDGIAKQYLTLDGAINFDNVLAELRTGAGLQTTNVSNHSVSVSSWRWYDNHVTLLFNLLRLYVMADLQLKGPITTGSYPKYDDGHVEIDLNAGLPLPDETIVWSWPGSKNSLNYPEWGNFTEYMPLNDEAYIDVGGLLPEEVKMVLMATGAWERQTNFKLDFPTPKLAERIYYRYPSKVTMIDDWLDGEIPDINFGLPNPKVVWNAIRKYVTTNNLYNQFYSAAAIINQVMLTPLPDSAEGMSWLIHEAQVVLPKFGSVRGRYPFLLRGEGALIQAKALEDWTMLQTNPNLLFSTSMVTASLFNIGLAVRDSMLRGIANDSLSGVDTSLFQQPELAWAAAVSLACGIDVPLNGMSNCYVYYPTLADSNVRLALPALIKTPRGYWIEGDSIVIDGVPFVGSPYVLYPLAVYDFANPYSGAFALPKPIRRTRKGAVFTVIGAWMYSWVARLAGYDVHISVNGSNVDYYKYFASNENSWVHPLWNGISDEIEGVFVHAIVRRNKHFLDIPDYTIPGNLTDVSVSVKILDRYVSDSSLTTKFRANYNVGSVTVPKSGIQVVTSGDLRKFWGYVRRSQPGLTMVGMAQPAIMPQPKHQLVEIDQEPEVTSEMVNMIE